MKYQQTKNEKFIDVGEVVQFNGEKQTYLVVSVDLKKKGNILQLTSNFNRKQYDCTNPIQIIKDKTIQDNT